MQTRTVRDLPSDFEEIYFLRVTDRRKILVLNVAGILLMGVSLLVFIGWLVVYHVLDAPLAIDSLPDEVPSLAGIVFVLMMLPIHEFVHGVAIQFFGHPVRYGIKPLRFVLYATADGALFWRNQYLIVALAPFVVISSIMFVLSLFLPAVPALWCMFAAAINATGAIGDLWMSFALRRFPVEVLVRDEEDGMRVFQHKE